MPTVIIALLVALFLQLNNKATAPDVIFNTLDGRQISMSHLKNQVVLVSFWATDCPSCIQEMPELIKTYQQYHPRGLEIIAVAMHYDLASQVENYSKAQAIPFPVMHDTTAAISEKFGKVSLTPTAFIYDKKGHLMQRTMGNLDFSALHQRLNKELNQ